MKMHKMHIKLKSMHSFTSRSGPDSTWFRPLGLTFETYFRVFVLYFALWTTVTLTHWNKGGEWGKNRQVEKDEGLKLCFWQNEELHSHETFIWHLFDPAQLKNSKGLGYDWHRDSNSDTKLSKKTWHKTCICSQNLEMSISASEHNWEKIKSKR